MNFIQTELNSFFIDPNLALKVDAINFIGFGITLICSLTFKPHLLSKIIFVLLPNGIRFKPSLFKFILFLVLGLAIKLYFVFYQLYFEDDLQAGLFNIISLGITSVSIIYGALSNEKVKVTISLLLALILFLIGIIEFNKTVMLLPILCFTVGYSISKKSKLIFVAGFILIFYLLGQLGNPILASRYRIQNINSSSIHSRLSLFIDGNTFDQSLPQEYSFWRRISYLDSQAAAINFYDRNYGGNDFDLIFWTLVPRFLFSDKPTLSAENANLYNKISGQEGSSTGIGLFVGGYYNLGWFGVLIYSVASGYIISQMSGLAKKVIISNNFYYFPFVSIGLYMVLRIDGSFVIDYLGIFVIVIYSLITLRVLKYLKR